VKSKGGGKIWRYVCETIFNVQSDLPLASVNLPLASASGKRKLNKTPALAELKTPTLFLFSAKAGRFFHF
jgi:hypothetical protein